jgi:hypothetical protein
MNHASPVAIFLFVVLAVIVVASVLFLIRTDPKKESFTAPPRVEPRTDFKIYNYLPTRSIRVDVLPSKDKALMTTGEARTLVNEVRSMSTGGLSHYQVVNYLSPDNIIRIYIFPPGKPDEAKHYTDILLTTKENERIKALHVGMITTRFIGEGYLFRDVTHFANAANGLPFVKIHNMTEQPISLNQGRIKVSPHNVVIYSNHGDRHDGVPLGAWFRDDDDIYPVFQYLQPQSDIYYVGASDLQQPLQGSWQPEFDFVNDPNSTMWPLQLGQY